MYVVCDMCVSVDMCGVRVLSMWYVCAVYVVCVW